MFVLLINNNLIIYVFHAICFIFLIELPAVHSMEVAHSLDSLTFMGPLKHQQYRDPHFMRDKCTPESHNSMVPQSVDRERVPKILGTSTVPLIAKERPPLSAMIENTKKQLNSYKQWGELFEVDLDKKTGASSLVNNFVEGREIKEGRGYLQEIISDLEENNPFKRNIDDATKRQQNSERRERLLSQNNRGDFARHLELRDRFFTGTNNKVDEHVESLDKKGEENTLKTTNKSVEDSSFEFLEDVEGSEHDESLLNLMKRNLFNVSAYLSEEASFNEINPGLQEAWKALGEHLKDNKDIYLNETSLLCQKFCNLLKKAYEAGPGEF